MKPNIPTMLTWLRILLIPVFVGAFYWPENLHKLSAMPSHWVNVFATSVFAIAAITDWLDGYLARRLNQTSSFGAFLDPVADKLMVAAALIVLVEFGRVGAIVSLIIIGREIAIQPIGNGGNGKYTGSKHVHPMRGHGTEFMQVFRPIKRTNKNRNQQDA